MIAIIPAKCVHNFFRGTLVGSFRVYNLIVPLLVDVRGLVVAKVVISLRKIVPKILRIWVILPPFLVVVRKINSVISLGGLVVVVLSHIAHRLEFRLVEGPFRILCENWIIRLLPIVPSEPLNLVLVGVRLEVRT